MIQQQSRKRFYPGVVEAMHDDGTCDILYDDGDWEGSVLPSLIRPSTKPLQSLEKEMEDVVSASAAVAVALRTRAKREAVAVAPAVSCNEPRRSDALSEDCAGSDAVAVAPLLAPSATSSAQAQAEAIGAAHTRVRGTTGDRDMADARKRCA